MESEIDLLRQENARLVAKNYELEAEIVKLSRIIEENARRDVRVKELEQKNTELEARLAILEQVPWQWMESHRTIRKRYQRYQLLMYPTP